MLAVLAQMMDRGDMGGSGWGWWWLVGLAVMIALVVLGVVVVLRVSEPGRPVPPDVRRRPSAEDVLAERLARGEIDEDEYRRRRDALRS